RAGLDAILSRSSCLPQDIDHRDLLERRRRGRDAMVANLRRLTLARLQPVPPRTPRPTERGQALPQLRRAEEEPGAHDPRDRLPALDFIDPLPQPQAVQPLEIHLDMEPLDGDPILDTGDEIIEVEGLRSRRAHQVRPTLERRMVPRLSNRAAVRTHRLPPPAVILSEPTGALARRLEVCEHPVLHKCEVLRLHTLSVPTHRGRTAGFGPVRRER